MPCKSPSEGSSYAFRTPDRPADALHPFAENTDDAAIFLFDTMDRATAQMLTSSPSAAVILTPQRASGRPQQRCDISDYDTDQIGVVARSSCSQSQPRCRSRRSASHSENKGSQRSAGALSDITVKHNSNGNCKTPRSNPFTPSLGRATSCSTVNSPMGLLHSVIRDKRDDGDETFLASAEDVGRLQRERKRFEKMYEHQKALYDGMRDRFTDTYKLFQQKVTEVIALSTRLELSKSLLRQLKKDSLENRTQIVNRENAVLEVFKKEQHSRLGAERELEEYRDKYNRLLREHKTKMAAMESLHSDLTCMAEDSDRLHVSQLDHLLTASYAKTTALYSDLMRQRHAYQIVCEEKMNIAQQLELARKEKRDTELRFLAELKRRDAELEALHEQSDDYQQTILNMRQMLIRTMNPSCDMEEEEEGSTEDEESEGMLCAENDSPSDNSFTTAFNGGGDGGAAGGVGQHQPQPLHNETGSHKAHRACRPSFDWQSFSPDTANTLALQARSSSAKDGTQSPVDFFPSSSFSNCAEYAQQRKAPELSAPSSKATSSLFREPRLASFTPRPQSDQTPPLDSSPIPLPPSTTSYRR